jgi:hypothetical protein
MSNAQLTDLRTRLGARSHVKHLLGHGVMGAAYLARELRPDPPVALKVLPAAVADDAALRDRVLRETRLAASFSHPNIVAVRAVEERDGLLVFAMRFVEGESLAERRQAVRVALLMLAIGIVSIVVAASLREPLGPGRYRSGPLTVALLFNGLSCCCVSVILWLRSPMRLPVGERAFRAFWLGVPGRWLLRWAMRDRKSRPVGTVAPSSRPITARVARPASCPARQSRSPAARREPRSAPSARAARGPPAASPATHPMSATGCP